MAKHQPHPFPLEPVMPLIPKGQLTARDRRRANSWRASPYVDPDDPEVLTELRKWRGRVRRAKAAGGFTIKAAEDVAADLQRHPTEIWSNYYEVVAGLLEESA